VPDVEYIPYENCRPKAKPKVSEIDDDWWWRFFGT